MTGTEVAAGGSASWFANRRTMTKVMIGVLPPLALLVALGSVALWNINKMNETSGWVDHTRVVLSKASGVVASAVDMETGMRGFLLAGEDAFLNPYTQGETAIYAEIEELQGIVGDNPRQVDRLGEAEAVLREWQSNVTEMQIALRREIGDAPTMNDIAATVGEARGKVFFDRFRAQIGEFIANERALLEARKATLERQLGGDLTGATGMAEALNWVTHTYGVIDDANAIIAAAVDMETGMRGYLLAGDPVFLEPYEAGDARFHDLIDAMRRTVSDNPQQVALLAEAEATIDAWVVEIVTPMIELRTSIAGASTMDDMADLVGEARGKQYFDRFREIMATFQAEEHALIAERQAQNKATTAETFALILGGIGVALVLGLGAAWLVGASIAGPIRRITASMRGLADGDTGVEIDGQTRRDEVGDMARATDVFKRNAIEKARLDSEAKAAADRERAAQAEREALQSKVSTVVGAASSGDFSARVDARFQDETLNQFASMMNGLLETVSKGVDETVAVMAALASGDLNTEMTGRYNGAFAQLQTNVNGTVAKLRSTVLDIQRSADAIKTATGEIAQGSGDLSSRAENQAASLEEIAATMEEMSATVKKNAENAVNASNVSADARNRADKGGQIVSQAVTAMGQIEEGSGKIAEIVSVIDGFAFQTNLLALNAAVEAARAGEAGKGFAVVASEVRTLAQRSADAARDIKALIQESSHQVSDGVRLVKETGDALKEIVEGIRSVSETITEISEASREQSSGVDEITAAITSMDEITQQNSALADESASAAKGLSEQAVGLEDMMRFFTVSGGARRATSSMQDRTAEAWNADAAADHDAASGARIVAAE